MNDFLTKNDVEIYAKEYLAELRDIAQHYISLIIEHDDDKHFINSIFEKVKCCTNPSRKVILLADENVSLDNFARAALQDKTIVIYFNPKLFDTFKNLKLMFDLAEQFIWHEATHLARMDKLGTDESHEGDIKDEDYLDSDAEINAFVIQSLSTTDDKDLAMDTYECCASDETYDKFINLRAELENNKSPIKESEEKEEGLLAKDILDLIENEREKYPFSKEEHDDVPATGIIALLGDRELHTFIRDIAYDRNTNTIVFTNKFKPNLHTKDLDDVTVSLANHLNAKTVFEWTEDGQHHVSKIIGIKRDIINHTYRDGWVDEGYDFIELIVSE